VVQRKSVAHEIKVSQFNPYADLYIPIFCLEKGFYFVGEVLFRRNFPTTLMYLIIFRHTERLVCDHDQNDGLVPRIFYSGWFHT